MHQHSRGQSSGGEAGSGVAVGGGGGDHHGALAAALLGLRARLELGAAAVGHVASFSGTRGSLRTSTPIPTPTPPHPAKAELVMAIIAAG